MKKEINENLIKFLPDNIINAKELGVDAKNLLGALLQRVETSKAGETGIVFVNQQTLAKMACIRKERLFEPLSELKLYNLLDWKTGTVMGNATEYYINWNVLEEPLKKPSFSERFGRFKTMGTTIQYSTIQNNPIQTNPNHNSTEQYNTDSTDILKVKKENLLKDKTTNQTNVNTIRTSNTLNVGMDLENIKKVVKVRMEQLFSRSYTVEDLDELEDELTSYVSKYSNVEGCDGLVEKIRLGIGNKRGELMFGSVDALKTVNVVL